MADARGARVNSNVNVSAPSNSPDVNTAAAKGASPKSRKRQSELKRAFTEDGALKTHVGGQALIEGVMMRGKYNWAAAVREPSGNIYLEEHDLASGKKKNSWLYWPIIRGCRAFVESLILGYKALEISALHAYGDEPDGETAQTQDADLRDSLDETALIKNAGMKDSPDESTRVQNAGLKDSLDDGNQSTDMKDDYDESAQNAGDKDATNEATQNTVAKDVTNEVTQNTGAKDVANEATQTQNTSVKDAMDEAAQDADTKDDSDEFGTKEIAISMILGVVLGLALFIVAPALIANLIVGAYDAHTFAWNIVDGIVRVAIFVFYIWLIGRMEDIKRMFGYHGAEHKTIHCYEHGLPLTPENARAFPRLHVRCGTAFLIMVMIIAIIVYTIVPLKALFAALGVPDGALKLTLLIVARIILMPLIAGISYEITVKWAGSHPENPIVRIVLWPGLQMQRLTTREPDDDQIECAIAAMERVLKREELMSSPSS